MDQRHGGAGDRPDGWRISIDHTFLLANPWHLLPLVLGIHVPGLGGIKGVSLGVGSLPPWAFGPGRYDGIEFSLTTSQLFGANRTGRWRIREGLAERYRAAGWPVLAFHACFEMPPVQFAHMRLDLTSEDPRAREGARAQVEAAARLAPRRAAGEPAPVVVFHSGRIPAGASRRDRSAAVRRVAANLRPAARAAERLGLRVSVENLPRARGDLEHLGSRRINDLVEIVAGVESDAVGITFDYGHANTFCGEDPEYTDRFLSVLGPSIDYAHLHYNEAHRPGFADAVAERRFEYLDQHLPLTRMPAREVPRFSAHLERLVRETPVGRRRVLGLELPQRTIFRIRRILPQGATPEEQVESARLLRGLLRRFAE